MKSTKKRGLLRQPEECGVWLDTAQLKKRPLQTRIPCTYSNRFNPLLRRPNVDSAVFEFTQTKTPQLCTKQTFLNSFFTPKNKTKSQPANKENLHSPSKEDNVVADDPIPLSIGLSLCLSPSYGDYDPVVGQLCENTSDKGSSAANLKTLSGTDEDLAHSPTNFRILATGKESEIFLHSPIHSPIHSFYPDGCKVLHAESCLDSQIFTQDTQGNKVIAHRSTCMQQKRHCLSNPLHDWTHATWDTTSQLKKDQQFLCDEDSLQKMFTQDSEGNMVIKH